MERLARNFVALTLHYQILKRQCGVSEALSPKEVSEHARAVTAEFLEAYFD